MSTRDERLAIQTNGLRGVVRLNDTEIHLLNPEERAGLRSGAFDAMLAVRRCEAFAYELGALLDRFGVPRFWTEHLT